jgi:hypothetical protein
MVHQQVHYQVQMLQLLAWQLQPVQQQLVL